MRLGVQLCPLDGPCDALLPNFCGEPRRAQGDFQYGKRHGYGVYSYADGGRFEGEWVDDKVHGRGVSVYSSGNRYEGEWVDGKINGQGTLWYADGDQYQGEWRDGKMHGRGTYTYADGDQYEGDWKDDRRHGKGTVTYAAIEGGTAEKYEGDWSDGKMHGYGKYFYADGGAHFSHSSHASRSPSRCQRRSARRAACTLIALSHMLSHRVVLAPPLVPRLGVGQACMKASGWTARCTAEASTPSPTATSMMASGSMMSRTGACCRLETGGTVVLVWREGRWSSAPCDGRRVILRGCWPGRPTCWPGRVAGGRLVSATSHRRDACHATSHRRDACHARHVQVWRAAVRQRRAVRRLLER